ncbi:MAG: ATP-binding cassette domain-containing protein [Anaerolineales bacterium]|nr:ATP-binding cassette domain-containing protein [Anaerolineales bacterium]
MAAAPLLAVEALSALARVPGGRATAPAFAPLSFELDAGERLAIIGPPDLISALARAVAVIEKPASGRVRLGGADLTRAWGGQLRRLRRALQYVGGEGRRALPPYASLGDVLAEPLGVHNLGRPAERRALAAQAAAAWQVNGWLLTTRAASLSHAMCQRVALARACLLQPQVLVCDALTDRLEPAAAGPLLALLDAYAARANLALLCLTADPAVAASVAARTLRLDPSGLHPN